MKILQRHWFLMGLMIAVSLGIGAAAELQRVVEWKRCGDLIVMAVMFATTCSLDSRSILTTLQRPAAPMLASFINMFVVPCGALVLSRVLPEDWAVGMIVVSAAPCTIASAAVWTRNAGGNDVVAVMVTVITNAACFLVAPLWLAGIARGHDVSIEASAMIVKLACLVLFPMAMGQWARSWPRFVDWSQRHQFQLSVFSQVGVLLMVFLGSVHCGLRLNETDMDPTAFWQQMLLMIVTVAVLHTSMLWLGQATGRWIGLTRPEWIAVGFAGSQKTLMVGLQISLMIGGGLAVLPVVAYHVCQLLIDTLAVDRLKSFSSEASYRQEGST